MAQTCVICSKEKVTYKCSRCRAPYCSVSCYRSHTLSPDCKKAEDEPSSALIGPASSVHTNSDASSQIKELLAQHPRLRMQLKQIYDASLDSISTQYPANKPDESTASALRAIRKLRDDGVLDSPEFAKLSSLSQNLADR